MNDQRLIDANALKKEVRNLSRPYGILNLIDAQPAIEPKRGEWVKDAGGVKCSVCGVYLMRDQAIACINNFCLFCGADMRGAK